LTPGDITGRMSSEIVADLAPEAKVVKAFDTGPMAWISDVVKAKDRVFPLR
jgi:predicted dinucleotide-binding enzyme